MQLNAFLWTIRSKLFKLQGFERLYCIKLHNKWVIGGNRVLPVIWVISSLHWRVQNLAGKLEQQAASPSPHITTGYDTACQHFPRSSKSAVKPTTIRRIGSQWHFDEFVNETIAKLSTDTPNHTDVYWRDTCITRCNCAIQ